MFMMLVNLKKVVKVLFLFCFIFLYSDLNISIAQSPEEPLYNTTEGVSNAAIEQERRIDEQIIKDAEQRRVDAACGGSKNYKCYTLIEPLGTGTNITKTIIIRDGGLSEYMNIIFMYLLMLIVVVSVFYLIYGGTLYLTTDIINKKLEGKEVIKRVVVGLIFVFSVWTIMNTINPNLLANTLNFNTLKDMVRPPDIDSESGVDNEAPIVVLPAGGAICPPENVVRVPDTKNGYIEVCKEVEQNMRDLIAAAKADGINLTKVSDRGDWRSNEQQIQLRSANCGGSANATNPAAKCNPPTALPGRSNHQGGRAIDFSEAGKSAGGKDSKAYKWLRANAIKYGFYNKIDVEPWHWSTTGR